ncbi:DoxX family protein [Caulobacter segnis]
MRKQLAQLPQLARGTDAAMLLLRLLVGVFLIHGVWDNVTSAARMAEFESFLAAHHCPRPHLAAPLSVYAQLICGGLFVVGLFTRWAGLVMAFNFVVAFVLVHLDETLREQFPALVLIAVSLVLATQGPGRYSLDARR